MPGKVDRPPDLVAELRRMRARIQELETSSNRLAAVAVLEDGTATLPSGTPTEIEFASAAIDTAGAFDVGEPDRLTIPYTGVYIVTASATIASNGATVGFRSLTIAADSSVGITLPPLQSNSWQGALSMTTYLTAGSTVILFAFQNSGTSLDATNGNLAISWLGNKPGDA